MAVDNTQKKSNFIDSVRACAALMKQARDQATILREKIASDAVIAAIADGDCVGANSYMTRAIIDNFLTGVTLDVEKTYTNQAVATSNRLPNLLAAILTT